MSASALLVEDERDFDRRYAEYRPKVRALLHRKAPWLDSDAREELYQQGWLAVFEARRRGDHVADELRYIFGVACNCAAGTVRSADSQRCTTFDPIQGKLVNLPDGAAEPGEAIALIDEAAVGLSLLARLGPRQHQVAVRRFGHGDTPEEICADLGISRSRYKKTIEKISKRLGELVADYHAGELTASDERLLARCVLGEANERERELASHLVDTAQGLALLCNVRHALRKAAMTTPLPAGGAPTVRDQLMLVLDQTKNTVGSMLGRGTASSGEAVGHVTASGSGGTAGRIISGIAACAFGAAAVGGGACLIAGVAPATMVDKFAGADAPATTTTQPEREQPPETVASPAPISPSTEAKQTTTTEPAPEATPPTVKPAEAAQREFGIQPQDESASSAQAPETTTRVVTSPAPPAASAPSGSGGGGRSEFGFEGR